MHEDGDLAALEENIGYRFSDRSLLVQALRHASHVNESGDDSLSSNERLEFLGDAALGFVVAALLYEQCAAYGEGSLTTLRAKLVRTESLAEMARRIDLGRFLLLGKGAEKNGERQNDTVLENAFEAVVGAVYLDGTAAAAHTVVRNLFLGKLKYELGRIRADRSFYDYKTTLQIELQRDGAAEIRYETVSETGPDHNKTFCVRVCLNGETLGEGEGKTKKSAEQNAAKIALEEMACI
jgi:ribonuclease-3